MRKSTLTCGEDKKKVDYFVTALYALAEHWNSGLLHDKPIRDRLSVGLAANMRLSERKQQSHLQGDIVTTKRGMLSG